MSFGPNRSGLSESTPLGPGPGHAAPGEQTRGGAALYRASIWVIHGFARHSPDCVLISYLNLRGGHDDFPKYLSSHRPFPISGRRTSGTELRPAPRRDRSKRETTRNGHGPAPHGSHLHQWALYADEAPPCHRRQGVDERHGAASHSATSGPRLDARYETRLDRPSEIRFHRPPETHLDPPSDAHPPSDPHLGPSSGTRGEAARPSDRPNPGIAGRPGGGAQACGPGAQACGPGAQACGPGAQACGPYRSSSVAPGSHEPPSFKAQRASSGSVAASAPVTRSCRHHGNVRSRSGVRRGSSFRALPAQDAILRLR